MDALHVERRENTDESRTDELANQRLAENVAPP
jgi:hypothetical protein